MDARTSQKILLTIFLLLAMMTSSAVVEGGVIYVDTTSNGGGSSWPDAYKYLQDAISVALDGDQIWVAEGMYMPDENLANPEGSGDRSATFQLKAGVEIYGGFPVGGGIWDNRDPSAFRTILSGDLNGDDDGSGNKSDNSYHVVSVFGTDNSTVLDGFIITAGNADGKAADEYGGGIYNYQSAPILNNCVVSGNSADKRAGGLYNRQGNPTLTNCIFSNNSSGNNGGAIYNHNSSPTIANSVFIGNSAGSSGGGINNGSNSQPEIINCTFADNLAGSYGGAIANDESHPTLINCILWGNTAQNGGQVSLLSSSSLSVSYSDLQGSLDAVYDDGSSVVAWGVGNIAEDPEFMPDNYHIQAGSPCIGAGDPDRDYSGQTDIDGQPRVMQQYVDMGSDEVETSEYYVDDDAISDPGPGDPEISDPLEDGSMEHPFDSIQEAVDAIGDGGTIYVLDGTYNGTGNYNINFGGKGITLSSLNGPSNCIIDCEGLGRGFEFLSQETQETVVKGFTVTNGQADYGGGFYCIDSSPKIIDCIITGNAAANHGGGLYLNGSSPILADCTISNNTPDGIWIENGNAQIVGTVNILSNDLVGEGGLEMEPAATLELHNCLVLCDLSGPGTIHSGVDSKLVIGGNAVIDLYNADDPDDNGTIICEGLFEVKDDVQINNANIEITVASFEDNAGISNCTITVNSIAPYGQFFIDTNVTISDNIILTDGDRYMNLDASIFAGNIQNNLIYVTITEGVGQDVGGLFELRGQDGLVSNSCAPEEFLCQVSPGTIPDCDPNTWTIERLELIEGAKLNLTNRSNYQPPYDFENDNEVLYVRELVLGQNSVLNTGFNRVYYETLVIGPGAIITSEPLIGFSLTNIALDDQTEFLIRVVHNNYEDPADPSNNRIHVERVTGQAPDPGGMMKMSNLIDQSTGRVVNARAKGLFAKSNEDKILIRFEYLFCGSNPSNEMVELVVYLSDVPELLEYNDPERIDHYLEVARLYRPPAGQHGSNGSEHLGIFEISVPRGDLDFIRGVQMELELVGPEGTCVLINNWDPFVECLYCGDVSGDFAISPRDYLTALGECGGLSSGTNGTGGLLYCLEGRFSGDGFVSSGDLSSWDWEEWLYSEGIVGNLCFAPCLACGASTSTSSATEPMDVSNPTAGFGEPQGSLLITGKRFNAAELDFLSDRLYELDDDYTVIGGPFVGNKDRLNGILVRDHNGQFYQVNTEDGLLRLSDNSIVIPRGQGVSVSSEPRYLQNAAVYIGLQSDGEDTWGKPMQDVAFDSQGYVYVTPVVVVPEIADAYVASVKLELPPTGSTPYSVIRIYDDPPLPNSNQDLTNLREIEIDSEGNVYVINCGYPNSSDILWVYRSGGGTDKCELQNLGIYAPIGLHCSSYDSSRLYVASAVGEPAAMSTSVYILSTTDLTLLQSIRVDDLGHITDITEDPVSGDLWVIGFTMPQYMITLPGNLSQMPQFYDPYLAEVPYGLEIPYDTNSVDATCISEVNDPNYYDLAMPLSIVWSGASACAQADFDNDTKINLEDFSILAWHWLDVPCNVGNSWCEDADTDKSGSVDLDDLFVLARFWLQTGCD